MNRQQALGGALTAFEKLAAALAAEMGLSDLVAVRLAGAIQGLIEAEIELAQTAGQP